MTDPTTPDDLLARASRDDYGRMELLRLKDELAAALRGLRDKNRELTIAIQGGCGCPAPYTDCPHSEPFLDQINRLVPEVERLRAENAQLRATVADWLHQ